MKIKRFANWISGLTVTRIALPLFALLLAVIFRDIVLILVRNALEFRKDIPTIYLGRKGPVANDLNAASYSIFACVLLVALAYVAYRLIVRGLENRNITELDFRGAAKEFGVGVLVGIGMIATITCVLWICGAIHVEPRWLVIASISSASAAFSAAFIEELAIRGIVFRVLESRLGTMITLGLTSLLFGALHLNNENASLFAVISIALTAGLVLGLAFVITRRLWFAIGLHFAANLTQGTILGMPVSGSETPGLFVSKLSGPTWLTGGEFGIESSIVTIILTLSVAILFGVIAFRANQFKPPFWQQSTG